MCVGICVFFDDFTAFTKFLEDFQSDTMNLKLRIFVGPPARSSAKQKKKKRQNFKIYFLNYYFGINDLEVVEM